MAWRSMVVLWHREKQSDIFQVIGSGIHMSVRVKWKFLLQMARQGGGHTLSTLSPGQDNWASLIHIT